jgi:hypothetical protein
MKSEPGGSRSFRPADRVAGEPRISERTAMNPTAILEQLARTPGALTAWLDGLQPDRARFKPPNGAWSIVEILAHLVDEERDDFRTRLRLTIESPEREWPRIDPEGWARERDYLARDLGEMLRDFERERADSIRWLRSLTNVDWSTPHMHPKFGPIRAGDLLASWAAHDALHVRQIAKRMFELAGGDGAAEGFSTRYAGEWSA